ncbi:MAG: preprotein translocase subunit SecE [Nocardioidaceae bacterium]
MAQSRGSTATPERARPPGGGGEGGPIARTSLFYRQVIAELRKVIRPTRDQLVTYWTAVLVFVLVIIAIVSVLDFALGWLMLRIFG